MMVQSKDESEDKDERATMGIIKYKVLNVRA